MIGSLNFEPLYAFHAKKSLKTNIANENTIRTTQITQKEANANTKAESENKPRSIRMTITKNARIVITNEKIMTARSNTIAWAA